MSRNNSTLAITEATWRVAKKNKESLKKNWREFCEPKQNASQRDGDTLSALSLKLKETLKKKWREFCEPKENSSQKDGDRLSASPKGKGP